MSEPKPLRLVIQEKLCEALRRVNRATPYAYDMAESVFRGRLLFGDSDPIPMLSIIETPIPAELWESPNAAAAGAGPWDLLIQGFVNDDFQNPTDPAHYLMADTKKVIAEEILRKGATPDRRDILGMGDIITNLTIHAGGVRPAGEDSSYANFWLRITVEFCEDNLNPFV